MLLVAIVKTDRLDSRYSTKPATAQHARYTILLLHSQMNLTLSSCCNICKIACLSVVHNVYSQRLQSTRAETAANKHTRHNSSTQETVVPHNKFAQMTCHACRQRLFPLYIVHSSCVATCSEQQYSSAQKRCNPFNNKDVLSGQ
jgi:hypothetical protein